MKLTFELQDKFMEMFRGEIYWSQDFWTYEDETGAKRNFPDDEAFSEIVNASIKHNVNYLKAVQPYSGPNPDGIVVE